MICDNCEYKYTGGTRIVGTYDCIHSNNVYMWREINGKTDDNFILTYKSPEKIRESNDECRWFEKKK